MSMWWLQPGWTEACCSSCGAKIWPEGDPDWGLCWPCMQHQSEAQQHEQEEESRYQHEMEEMERQYRLESLSKATGEQS